MTHQEIADELEALREKHSTETRELDDKQSRERKAVAAKCAEVGHIYVRDPLSYACMSCGICGTLKLRVAPALQVAESFVVISEPAIKSSR